MTVEHVLDPDEFDLLTPAEQDEYLALLQSDLEAWQLTDNPKQVLAKRLLDEGAVDELLYGGSAGGGKTELGLFHAHERSMAVPGHRSLYLRSSFPELRRSVIARSWQRIPVTEAKYRTADKEWRYTNGSVIEFGFCASDADARQFLSAEYDAIIFDEATEFSDYQLSMIGSRARTTRYKRSIGSRPHVLLLTNPGGVSHNYVRKRYVDPTNHGQNIVETELTLPDGTKHVRRIGFVQALVGDNPHIDPTYVANLMVLPKNLRDMYLYGSWDAFEGQFFDAWDHETHVIDPFPIPPSWRRGIGIDYGYGAPMCCLWVAWDNDSNAYVYRELYKARLTPVQQAKLILSMSGDEKIKWRMADPSTFSSTGIGDPISEQWARGGLRVAKANNERNAGWANVRDYLEVPPDGPPALHVFRTCPEFIRTFPACVTDKTDPEDMDTRGEDHAADALRYILNVHPRPKRKIERVVLDPSAQRAADFLKARTRAAKRQRFVGLTSE